MIDFDKLRDAVLPPLLELGVTRVAVFGSIARGEETPESDLDLLVLFKPRLSRPMGFFGLADLEEELSNRAGRTVEIAFADALKPYLQPRIEAEQVILYEES